MNPFESPRSETVVPPDPADLPSLAGLLFLVASFAYTCVHVGLMEGEQPHVVRVVQDPVWIVGLCVVALGFRRSSPRLAAGIGLYALVACVGAVLEALGHQSWELRQNVLLGVPLFGAALGLRARQGRAHLGFLSFTLGITGLTLATATWLRAALPHEPTAQGPVVMVAVVAFVPTVLLYGLVLFLLTFEAIRARC